MTAGQVQRPQRMVFDTITVLLFLLGSCSPPRLRSTLIFLQVSCTVRSIRESKSFFLPINMENHATIGNINTRIYSV
jgi:hypothetical protein